MEGMDVMGPVSIFKKRRNTKIHSRKRGTKIAADSVFYCFIAPG